MAIIRETETRGAARVLVADDNAVMPDGDQKRHVINDQRLAAYKIMTGSGAHGTV